MKRIFEKDENLALEILKFVKSRLLIGKRSVSVKYGASITDRLIDRGYLKEDIRIERYVKGIKPTLVNKLAAKLLGFSKEIFKDKQYHCSVLELTPKGAGLLNYD